MEDVRTEADTRPGQDDSPGEAGTIRVGLQAERGLVELAEEIADELSSVESDLAVREVAYRYPPETAADGGEAEDA